MAENNGILDVIKSYTSSAPVDVYKLAEALGIVVVEKSLIDDISGSIEKSDDSYTITINSDHSENRKRFTVAHELGHFILHDDLIGDGIEDRKAYRSYDGRGNRDITQHHETQANKVAASLLMPLSLISKLKEDGITAPSALATKLGVSNQAMTIRLCNVES